VTDAALIDRFLEMMGAEAGAARNTLSAYRSDLRLASTVLACELVRADEAAVHRLAESWRDLSRSTVARKAAALRRFFAFLVEEGHRPDDPGDALPRPGAGRTLPKTLSHADVDRLFDALAARLAKTPVALLDLRLAALIELLYGSGLRASELVALPRTAIHPDRPFLILKGKGGRERLAPVSDRARAAVATWRAHVPTGQPWLFPSGKTHLSRIRLYQLVKALAAEAAGAAGSG
jgi:integrase/recombinase XerD